MNNRVAKTFFVLGAFLLLLAVGLPGIPLLLHHTGIIEGWSGFGLFAMGSILLPWIVAFGLQLTLIAILLRRMNWKSRAAGDELDDVSDMVRYAMLTWFETSSKPREVAIEQKLEEYRANGLDDYSLTIHRLRMEREDRQRQEQPVHIGRRHGIIVRR